MSEPTTPVPPAPGLFARAIGVITSPKATFEKVVAAPKVAGMMFLVAVVMGLTQGVPQMTEKGQQAALDMQVQQIEKFTGQPVSDQMYTQMERRARFGGYLSIVSMLIFLPIFFGIFSAIFWAAFNVALGGTATFRHVLAVVVHGGVITGLGAALGAPVQYLQGTLNYAGPFNLGVLFPMLNEGSFLATFLGMISVFNIWGTIVTAIGLGVLYRRSGRAIAIVLLIIYGLFSAAVAAFLSR